MPRGNPQNLRPGEYKLSLEEAKKGGKKSAQVRREKKTIKTLLNDYLESECKDSPQFQHLAEQLGLKGTESIKQLFTIACVLNSVKGGDLRDLGLLQTLLDEESVNATEEIEDDPLTKALKEEAERMNKDG